MDNLRLHQDQDEAFKNALQTIAGMCDGAFSRDGCGFSKNDTDFGKSLAMSTYYYSPKQLKAAMNFIKRYRRQLTNEQLEACGFTGKTFKLRLVYHRPYRQAS